MGVAIDHMRKNPNKYIFNKMINAYITENIQNNRYLILLWRINYMLKIV